MRNLVTVGILAALVYGWNFWGTSIYMLDEVKNAWSAYEMMNSGNWFTPVFNGEFHDKPGLQYFFMQVAYFFFGVNPFSARLFSVLFGVATVLVVYQFAKRQVNADVATLSSIALIASLQLSFQFKMSVPDPYLIFFLTCAFISFYNAYIEKSNRAINMFYLFAGLAFVTKGPIAIALPALVVGVFLILVRDFKPSTILWILNWKGILIFLAIGTPWYIANGLATDWKWTEYFFITHNVDRYLNTFEGHGGFPFDTFVLFFAALLPFSVFFPQAFVLAWRERRNSLWLFCTSLCLAFCTFFLFSRTVLPGYVSPALPFGAIILGNYLQHLLNGNHSIRKTQISLLLLILITTGLVVVGYSAIKQEATLTHLAIPSLLTLIILPVGSFIALFFLKRNVTYSLFVMAVSFFLFQAVLFSALMPAADKTNPVVQSKDLIHQQAKPFAYYKRMNPAFVFQHHQNIKKLNSTAEIKEFLNQHGEVIIISTLREWQQDSIPGFKIVFQGKDLYESPQTVILSNRQAQ